MDPKKIRIKGITSAHVREIVLDLDGLPEGLIAVVGPNGAGKTTLLESLGPLALFGRSPSRGCNVTNLAIAGDSAIELEGDHGGHRWRVLRRLDAGKGTHEGYLTIDGEDTGTGGRVRDLDDQVARRFLPPALYLASIYAAQHGRGSFVGLKEAERRDLFADLLGIGALQGLSEEAQKVAAAAADALGEVDRRLAKAREASERAATLQAQVDERAGDVARLEAERAEAGKAWEASKEAARELATSVRQARQALADLEGQDARKLQELEGNRLAIREYGSEIARWAATAEGLAEKRAELQAAEAAEARIQAAAAGTAAKRAELQTAKAREAAHDARIRELRAELARLEEARGLGEELVTLRAGLEELATKGRAATTAATVAQEALQVAQEAERQARQAESAAQRQAARLEEEIRALEPQAELLERVPCGGRVFELRDADPGELDCGTCELLGAARQAAERLPGLRAQLSEAVHGQAVEKLGAAVVALREAQAADTVARQARDELRATYRERAAELEAKAARVPEDLDVRAEAARQALEAAEAEALAIGAAVDNAGAAVRGAEALEAQARKSNAAGERVPQLRAGVQAAEAAERQEGQARARLEGAQKRGLEIQDERDALLVRLGQARQALEDLAGSDPDDRIRGAEARAALSGQVYQEADGRLQAARAELAELRGALGELARGGATVEALEAARAELDTIQARHALLAAALGRKGVQAHEIDGAGPMVSGLVNDLLGSCYGERFRAELVTKQEAEKGRKEREVFELRIWDAARGDRRSFDDLSGGEQVVIDEALKLALALLTSRRSGIRCGALFRDEVDGKLDTDNAEAYPRMLRRAAELGGFRRVYFVSHRAEVYGQADARIRLGGDGPRVELA